MLRVLPIPFAILQRQIHPTRLVKKALYRESIVRMSRVMNKLDCNQEHRLEKKLHNGRESGELVTKERFRFRRRVQEVLRFSRGMEDKRRQGYTARIVLPLHRPVHRMGRFRPISSPPEKNRRTRAHSIWEIREATSRQSFRIEENRSGRRPR